MNVILSGAFDLLHSGHIDIIKFAAASGDKLIICIDSDSRISKTKGADRPINTCDTSKYILRAIRWVDEVIEFNSDDELISILKDHQPHIRVCGSDWKDKNIVGEEWCNNIDFFERENDESTTKTLENYINRR